MGYGKGADLEGSSLEFLNDLDELTKANVTRTNAILAISANEMLLDLQSRYSKLINSGGESNRFTSQQLYARIGNTADLLPPAYQKNILQIMKEDLKAADNLGRKSGVNLNNILKDGSETIKANAKPNIAAINNSGKRLNDFWAKENTQFRDRVRSLTQNAAAQGMSWRKLSLQVRELLLLEQAQGTDSKRSQRVNLKMGVTFRADTIARTELATAYVQGQIAHYREQGFEWGRWSAAAERTCGFCMSRDGLVYTMDDLEAAIPAHPRCRCSIIPTDPPRDMINKGKVDPKDASDELDDLYWTKSRQDKLNVWKDENRGIRDPKTDSILNNMLRNFAETPTNSQAFLRPGTPAPKPQWMPSGEIIPDVKKAADAQQGSAARQEAEGKAKEKAEAEAKIKEAEAAKKQQEADELKRLREEERRRAEKTAEADKAALAKQKELSAELEKTLETYQQRVNDTKTRLQMAEIALARINKMKPEAAADLKLKTAKANEHAERFDKATRAVEILRAEVAKQTKALAGRQNQLRKINETIDGLTIQIEAMKADAKAGGGGKSGLSDVEYGQKIARMSHTKESFNRMSQDVLNRAGVNIKDLSSRAKTKSELQGKIEMDEFLVKNAKGRIKDADNRIKDQEAKLKKMPADDKWMVEQTIEIHKRNRADDLKTIKNFEDNIKSMQKELKTAPDMNPSVKAAQKVIDELYRTSALSAGDALKKVQGISGEANYRKLISERGAFQSTPNLTDLADAARMFGGLHNLRAYGVTDSRGFAAEPGYDPATNRFRENAPRNLNAFLNAGTGKAEGKFRKTQFHELGHFVEFSHTDIYLAAKQFIGEHIKPNRMKPGSIKGYSRNEKFFKSKDGYEPVNPYVLKDYTPAVNGVSEIDGMVYNLQKGQIPSRLHRLKDATEVTSMGLETLSDPVKLANLAAVDPDHLLLTLGVARLAQARSAAGIKQFNFEDYDNSTKATADDIPVVKKDAAKNSIKKTDTAKDIRKAESDLKKAMGERDEFFEMDWDQDPENLLEQANDKLGKIGDLDGLRAIAGKAQVELQTARSRVEAIDNDLNARNSRLKDLTEDLANYEKDLSLINKTIAKL